jgi:hypothetical protein
MPISVHSAGRIRHKVREYPTPAQLEAAPTCCCIPCFACPPDAAPTASAINAAGGLS